MQAEIAALEIGGDFAVEPGAPDVPEGDSEWLFDSDRDYVAQISFYKQHKGQ